MRILRSTPVTPTLMSKIADNFKTISTHRNHNTREAAEVNDTKSQHQPRHNSANPKSNRRIVSTTLTRLIIRVKMQINTTSSIITSATCPSNLTNTIIRSPNSHKNQTKETTTNNLPSSNSHSINNSNQPNTREKNVTNTRMATSSSSTIRATTMIIGGTTNPPGLTKVVSKSLSIKLTLKMKKCLTTRISTHSLRGNQEAATNLNALNSTPNNTQVATENSLLPVRLNSNQVL